MDAKCIVSVKFNRLGMFWDLLFYRLWRRYLWLILALKFKWLFGVAEFRTDCCNDSKVCTWMSVPTKDCFCKCGKTKFIEYGMI